MKDTMAQPPVIVQKVPMETTVNTLTHAMSMTADQESALYNLMPMEHTTSALSPVIAQMDTQGTIVIILIHVLLTTAELDDVM